MNKMNKKGIIKYKERMPVIDPSAYIAPGAAVIGKVSIGSRASVWPGAVLRGDVDEIKIGEDTNIQDGAMVHTNYNMPVLIGKGVSVGHGAILHGCSVSDFCLISIGAILLDGCRAEKYCIVASGAVVPQGKTLSGGYVYMGTPAVKKRKLKDSERELIRKNAQDYLRLSREYGI